jgi:hypothetical protein
MTPELSGHLADAAAKAAEQQKAQPKAEPAEAAEEDVAKFEKLMADGKTDKPAGAEAVNAQQETPKINASDATQQVQPAQPEQQVAPVGKAEGPELVDQLQHASEEIKVKRQEILDRLATSDNLSPKELLELQFKLADLTMQQTLIGKAGEKGGQAVQQLFRG